MTNALESQIEAMCAEFERIMWDTPQVLLRDLQVGDYVLYLVSVSRVTKITKTHVETTQDKHPLYWTHQTMGRITEADARYVATNWDAWRVWVIAGKEGMLKCALKVVRP